MAEAAKRDYYEVLGLGRDADAKAIRDAFRRLALQYHPDRNKEAGAEERFKEIAEAYPIPGSAPTTMRAASAAWATWDQRTCSAASISRTCSAAWDSTSAAACSSASSAGGTGAARGRCAATTSNCRCRSRSSAS